MFSTTLYVALVLAGACQGTACTLDLSITPGFKPLAPGSTIQAPRPIPIDFLYTCLKNKGHTTESGEREAPECPSTRPLLFIKHEYPKAPEISVVAEKDEALMRYSKPDYLLSDEDYKINLAAEPVLYNSNDDSLLPLDKVNFLKAVFVPKYDAQVQPHIALWRESHTLDEAMALVSPRTKMLSKSYHWRIRGPAMVVYAGGTHSLSIMACTNDGTGKCIPGTEQRTRPEKWSYNVECSIAQKWSGDFEKMRSAFENATRHNLRVCVKQGASFMEERTDEYFRCASLASESKEYITNYVVFYAMVCTGGVNRAADFYRHYATARNNFLSYDPDLSIWPEAITPMQDPAQKELAIRKAEEFLLMHAYEVALMRVTTVGYDLTIERDKSRKIELGPNFVPYSVWKREFIEKWASTTGRSLFGITP